MSGIFNDDKLGHLATGADVLTDVAKCPDCEVLAGIVARLIEELQVPKGVKVDVRPMPEDEQ